MADMGVSAESNTELLTGKASAKQDAAIAAISGASAKGVSGSLAVSFQRRFQKFDAAVVASNANRLYWPSSSKLSALQFGASMVPLDATVCLNIGETQNFPIRTSQIAVRTDGISDFLSLLVRRGTRKPGEMETDEFGGLIGLPPTSHVASMDEVFSSLVCSKPFLKKVRQLTIFDASASDEPSELADFVRSASNLEALSLVNCSLNNDMTSFVEALKDREVQHLNLDRCCIGCSSTDAEREAILTLLSAYLKMNKFITSLDVSYTNLDAGAVSSLMSALVESDTQMLPQDMTETPDVFDPSDLSERLSVALFLGEAGSDSAENSESEGGEDEDDAGDGDDESMTSSQVTSNDASGNDDDADNNSEGVEEEGDEEEGDEEEGDEEEGEDEDEDGRSSGVDKVAATKGQRRRERLRAEREQQKQHRRQVKKLVQLEAYERRALIEEYLSSAREIVSSSSTVMTECYSEEKQKAKELYCSRRSGWSRLQTLVLRGNRLGDSGAKRIALVLREEVPLTEDDARERQEAVDAKRGALGADFGAGRAVICVEEAVAWRVLQQTARNEYAEISALYDEAVPVVAAPVEDAPDEDADLEEEDADVEEEDEYAKAAPPVVLTNVENRRGSGGEDDEAAPNDNEEELLAEEKRVWEEWVAEGLPQITVVPMKKGMRSITLLDLGSCHIGRKGLEALAGVLRTNTVLESLCLRHNPIGSDVTTKSATTQPDATCTLSDSFGSFVEMLSVNKSLHTLDLGYCQLGPDHIRALATVLRENPALITLGLEGNQLGVDASYCQKQHSYSYLYDLWMAAAQPGGALRHLHMSHNSLALCLWSEEAAALAAACGQLTSLSLSHIGLQESHLRLWSQALQQGSGAYHPTVRVLQLARNEFTGEAGGIALDSLLQHFTLLEELSLDGHPLLGSAGVAAALQHLPTTMRGLSCAGTGLSEPFVGAAQSPVIPLAVTEQLTSLMLCDVEAPAACALATWTTHLAEVAKNIQFLSLWARGMAGKENEVLSHFVHLALVCPSLLYVDCGFQPQFRASAPGSEHFAALERLLFPRRMRLPR
ncbi:hypothetical protein ABL78_1950 [Leptomonas seymouri]|uniref:Leucine-rich repeat protein n=1 Tax=Leptomonas seymouri TaxID=5684 RepID=A0A0N1IM54_LEPSE|nr:hypothetical protein ABL78_1950 [Leptomonas seymouri]|eukprot:KPI88984.1 hypothetical protein ABL78_1950 [Leptomonas seymouri]